MLGCYRIARGTGMMGETLFEQAVKLTALATD
jgi:hypothetical protein